MPTTIEPPVKAKKKPKNRVSFNGDKLVKTDTSAQKLGGTEYNAGKPVRIPPQPVPQAMADALLNISSQPERLLSAAPYGMHDMSAYLSGMSDSQLRRAFKICTIEAATHDLEEMGVLGTNRAKGFLTGLFRCLEVFHNRFIRLDPPVGVRGKKAR